MKKIILFLIIIFLPINVSYADFSVTCELRSDKTNTGWQPTSPLFFENGIAPILIEVNGKQYFWESLKNGNHIIEYTGQDEATYNFLKEQQDCIWTGEYYMTRKSQYDNQASRKRFIKNPVQFYDENFNLVHEQVFGVPGMYDFPEKIAYENGKYYCRLYDGQTNSFTVSSTDTINWNEENDYLWKTKIGNVEYGDSNSFYGISISGSEFYRVKFEKMYGSTYTRLQFGKYICGLTKTDLYFSTNNLYWLKVPLGQSIDVNPNSGNKWVYESGDDIVFEANWYVIKTPKQIIYDALDEMSKLPYVVYNDYLLAFEVAPVIQDDRTLIPIRFLFEQMGADVEWNGDTQTATITQNDTAVAFSINETEADVNGQTVTMDVPAQLINGKTMVPVRFLSEELGYSVEWDGETRIITIE